MKTEYLTVDPENFSLSVFTDAAERIRAGELVAFPTETVYGLGASGCNGAAVKKIYAAKGRPSNNPLILHFPDIEQIDGFAVTDRRFQLLADAFLPGPLTVVLPSRGICAPEVTAGLPTVAVRVPVHPVARAFLRACGVPVAAPSANLSGKPSPTTAEHVRKDMDGRIPLVIDGGPCSVGLESTIVKLGDDGAVLLRPGGVTLEMLRSVLGDVRVADAVLSPPAPGAVPESPGMLLKHYAPDAPLYLVRSSDSRRVTDFLCEKAEDPKNSVLLYDGEHIPAENVYFLGARGDEGELAHRLFDLLRAADRPEAERIYAPMPDRAGIGLALQNRMLRAAAFRIKDL
ncbi:MAG: L-threonylcarbamoyladenylate synthase [Eubacteriales bacterium]